MAKKAVKKEGKAKKDNGALAAVDLRGKTRDELNDLVVAFKKEQMNLRFQKTMGTLQAPLRNRVLRRNIAKINTVLNEVKIKEAKNA